MKMSKKRGTIFIIMGTLLMLSALSLFLYNRYEDARAGKESEKLLSDLQTALEEDQEDALSEDLPPELPVVEMEGYGYIGYLSIPSLELELPIMSEWDYDRLKIAPCRHFGSSRTDDLVIAAHNYKKHFGYLSQLESGATVFFMDMDGIKNEYEVTLVQTLVPTDVEAVQKSDHDLALYTCTYGGKARMAVFCDRLEK
ncbi:MAG: sortase [Peptoniphilus sp.]|nr:sortase [Peptoniphilus sp.]